MIVDLVQTGATLRENGLVELRVVLESSGGVAGQPGELPAQVAPGARAHRRRGGSG